MLYGYQLVFAVERNDRQPIAGDIKWRKVRIVQTLRRIVVGRRTGLFGQCAIGDDIVF